MSTYQLILKRRSIRRFLPQSIPLNILLRLANAARVAPSAANLQPLEYVIIDDPEQVDKVFPTLNWAGYIEPKGNPPEGERPAAYIVVLTNQQIKSQYYPQDAGAAIENMILTAMEEGLGSCWIESIDREVLSGILELKQAMIINAVLALGYPDEEPLMEELSEPEASIEYWKDERERLHVPKRRLETVLHYNRYEQTCPISSDARDWALVMETSIEEEAYVVKGFLENNGIPCVIEALKFHELPVNFGPMSKVRLLVPQDKLQEGKNLLAERSG